MPVKKYKIDIESPRNDSGWVIEVNKKRKYFYVSAKEHLLPHDLEVKLDKFLTSQSENIKNLFNISVSVFMSNQKMENENKVIEFIQYMEDLIKTENL
ncbi:hypothetical protein [Acinetobacter radioresistens]|uniref:hypothetical protein n=1 Tax=Acinetobacter radioresistens TaxID=40216 RepID=UPI00094652C4|nr:hypothetical protein [Acinetobacter radioresistens]